MPSQKQSPRTVKLLQISDCHLFEDAEHELLGIKTDESLSWVMQLAVAQLPVDHILMTGDLAQDSSVKAYQRLQARLQDLATPSSWICGNHDSLARMQESLPENSPCLEARVVLGAWQILMLQSQVEGAVHGFLDEQNLALLEEHAKDFDGHTLVCVHHHPVASNSAWLDKIDVHNKDAFWAKLAELPSVKAVLFGHIHQELDRMHQGVRVLAVPSTCFQFACDSADFKIGDEQPGCRVLELHADGRIDTEVLRVTEHKLQVDAAAGGY